MKRNLAPTSAALTIALGFIGATWPQASQAQQAALPPLNTPAPAATPIDDFGPNHLDLPFVLRNNWIIIDVKLGKDADALRSAPILHFLLDTGCTDTILSAEAFESKKLALTTSELAKGNEPVNGVGPSGVRVSKVVDCVIELGGTTAAAKIEVVPAGSDVTNQQIDGAIGSDLLRNYVVVIDYERRIVKIYPPNEFQAPATTSNFVAIPIEFSSSSAPIAQVDLTPFGYSNCKARLVLDTGAMGAVTLYSPFVSRNKWQDVLATTTATLSGGVGGRIKSTTGKLKALTLGGTSLGQPPVDFSSSTAGVTASDEADGQLGGRVFRRFTMIFDYGHRILYIRPNASSKGPFPIQYYFGFARPAAAARSSDYAIGYVEPRSPAATADVRVGDIIYTIDSQTIGALSEEEIDACLQQSGKPRKFEIGRGAQRFEVTITPIAY